MRLSTSRPSEPTLGTRRETARREKPRRDREKTRLLAALESREAKPSPDAYADPPTLERWDRVESRWNLGSVLVLLAGAALAVVGLVAVARTGIDATWYTPVHQVAGIAHTPLSGAIEVGVGVLLVIAGLAGAPGLAAFVSISAAMAAGVVAVEPDLVAEQLAPERWWAIVLAVAGAGLAVLSMVPWPRFVERHYTLEADRARASGSPTPGLIS